MSEETTTEVVEVCFFCPYCREPKREKRCVCESVVEIRTVAEVVRAGQPRDYLVAQGMIFSHNREEA